jgi:hypothetical protein
LFVLNGYYSPDFSFSVALPAGLGVVVMVLAQVANPYFAFAVAL